MSYLTKYSKCENRKSEDLTLEVIIRSYQEFVKHLEE